MKTIGKARASRYPLDWPFKQIPSPYEQALPSGRAFLFIPFILAVVIVWPFNIISNPYEWPFRQEGLSFLGNYIHFGSCKEAGINLGNTELALYFYRLP